MCGQDTRTHFLPTKEHKYVYISNEFIIKQSQLCLNCQIDRIWEKIVCARGQPKLKMMNSQQTLEQHNYPIFFDYQNYCENVPSLNYAEYLTSDCATFFAATGKQTSFCEICDQQFRTPVIYNRHMRSRKHALKCIRTKMNRKRSKTNENLTLLPNEVIDSLIRDLRECSYEKDTFFGEIDLGMCDDNIEQSQLLPSFKKIFTTNGTESQNTAQHINLNNNIPKIYPCSLCFRTLHSQELFDQHLQEKHLPIYYDWFCFFCVFYYLTE